MRKAQPRRVDADTDSLASQSSLRAGRAPVLRHDADGVVGVMTLHRILARSLRERLIFAGVLVAFIISGLTAAFASQTTSDGVIAACAMTAGAVWVWRARHAGAVITRPWILFATGYVCWGIAETIWFGYDLFAGGSPPQPSVADPVYMVGYVLIAAGVTRLVLARGIGGTRTSAALDALALTIAMGTILVQLELVAPGTFRERLERGERARSDLRRARRPAIGRDRVAVALARTQGCVAGY